MNIIGIYINLEESKQDLLISELSDLGAVGFEQKAHILIAYFPELDFNSYGVNDLLKGLEYSVQTLPDQNWNALWESNFSPVEVDDFCYVRASFHAPETRFEHEIIITPKMSFGTGHHATTYMMIKQMKAIDLKGKKVFDFGTGTGILSILAEKSGAAEIYAIDIDGWSIENAKENAELNNCSKISIELSTQIPLKKFDLILANINRNVILEYLPQLIESLEEKGEILFSGLLINDEPAVMEACKNKLVLTKRMEKDNWISLLMRK